ncbi:hypothetical protein LDO26_16080 [Luteimonas sp. BDR2-5]|uniref:hypothetical protein n=1 Tax=Proluteimonas luteida TaxID=2878685 RepID=UPI001E41BB0A|nr:hypothetical protein [Luteimonas sp. BDR2-5]MCD9029712.1 hypothetical protein [Luteimonas sp. BDR2-5]
MSRLGLTNIYLKCGLVLILLGLGCGAVVFMARPADFNARQLLLWLAMGSFFSGLVLYVIGRIVHAMRAFART